MYPTYKKYNLWCINSCASPLVFNLSLQILKTRILQSILLLLKGWGGGGQLQRLQKYMRRKIMSYDFISLLSVSTYNYIRFILFSDSKNFI